MAIFGLFSTSNGKKKNSKKAVAKSLSKAKKTKKKSKTCEFC